VYRALAVALRRGTEQVRDDLRADPGLRLVLLLAAFLSTFWLWHRLPNFATRDERWRVLDPIQPVGFFVEDPTLGSIREGVTYWRSYGGTFYIYGLVLLPVVVFLLATGDGGILVDLATYSNRSLRADWQRVPGWVWTALVLPARLVNALLAVGSVYLVYRIGTEVRDRATGRLAALLLSLTWGLLVLAHEAGEDVPALFCFLLATYLALRYLESGSRRTFYLGCLVGGLAAGFKFSAGVAALVLGAAYLTRARRADGSWRAALARPRFLLTGVAIGVVCIAVSYPQTLVGAPTEVGGRITRGVGEKSNPHSWVDAPSWWWLLRGTLNGLGLPLTVAGLGAAGAAVGWLREDSRAGDLARLSLLALGTLLLVLSQWAYVRTHHLLLAFPLLVLLVAVGARRLHDRRPRIARVLVALLLVTTGAYAVTGDLGYAAQGRDRSAAWLSANAGPNATVEVYPLDPQEFGVPHGADFERPPMPEGIASLDGRCPDYIALGYHRGLLPLAPADHSDRAGRFDDPDEAAHVRDLLRGDGHPYEVAGRFGPRPRYLDGTERPAWRRLLRAGVQPRTVQYGDPQDLGPYQYTVVLERTGDCATPSRTRPR
jgi:hypothetical protein